MSTDIKSFFHEWCAKSRNEPTYESRPTGKSFVFYRLVWLEEWRRFFTDRIWLHIGPKHRQRFLCELRVSDLPYVGAGNSTNKKDAERNAARDFVNFLVRTGRVNASDIPADVLDGAASLPARAPDAPAAPVFGVCTTNL